MFRYGILVQNEQKDLKLLLTRVFASAMSISEFNQILSCKSCSISSTEFMKRIDKELCLAHCLNQTDAHEDGTKIAELYDALTEMCESHGQFQDVLIEGIFETIRYLSDDVNEYLKQNYLVALLLISAYFSKKVTSNDQTSSTEIKEDLLRNIFMNKDGLQFGAHNISYEVLQDTLKRVPILQCVIDNKPKKNVSMYELLDGYKNLNVKQLYKWRFNNDEMPHFSNETLVKKYGYIEALTYEYYLKEARPNMAIFVLKHYQGKLVGNVSTRR